jgi:hypothetical protein
VNSLTNQQQSLADHGLPSFTWDWTSKYHLLSVMHTLENQASLVTTMQAQLNLDQQSYFTQIMTAIELDPQIAHFYL